MEQPSVAHGNISSFSFAPELWVLLSLSIWASYVWARGWRNLSVWDKRHVAFGILSALLFLNWITYEEFQGWADVYYFCGSKLQYCTCNFKWNLRGWMKAYVLWSYVLSSAQGLQRMVLQLGLNGLLPGEEVVTRESIISICWRLIPYWLNNWEQQWGAECSSMMFEMVHWALELLVILPCVQILCARLKVLVMPVVRLGTTRIRHVNLMPPGHQRHAQQGRPQLHQLPPNVQVQALFGAAAAQHMEQQQQQPDGGGGGGGGGGGAAHAQAAAALHAAGRMSVVGLRRQDLAPNILRGYWEPAPQQRRLLPRLRAHRQVLLFTALVTGLAALNSMCVPLLLEDSVTLHHMTPTIHVAGQHAHWFTNTSTTLNVSSVQEELQGQGAPGLSQQQVDMLNARLMSYHSRRSTLKLSLPSFTMRKMSLQPSQKVVDMAASVLKWSQVDHLIDMWRQVQQHHDAAVSGPRWRDKPVAAAFHFLVGGNWVTIVSDAATAIMKGSTKSAQTRQAGTQVWGDGMTGDMNDNTTNTTSRADQDAAGVDSKREYSAFHAAQHASQPQVCPLRAAGMMVNSTTAPSPCAGRMHKFRENLVKHAEEIAKMRAPEHRSLVPLVETALAIMRLSCEKYFVLLAVLAAHLIWREEPPRTARYLIRANAYLSSGFQKIILYSFPAVCWIYGAGLLFSLFVSAVFWGSPAWAAYKSIRAAITVVRIKDLRKATPADLERMGGNCTICWGGMHCRDDGDHDGQQQEQHDHGSTTQAAAHAMSRNDTSQADIPASASEATAADQAVGAESGEGAAQNLRSDKHTQDDITTAVASPRAQDQVELVNHHHHHVSRRSRLNVRTVAHSTGRASAESVRSETTAAETTAIAAVAHERNSSDSSKRHSKSAPAIAVPDAASLIQGAQALSSRSRNSSSNTSSRAATPKTCVPDGQLQAKAQGDSNVALEQVLAEKPRCSIDAPTSGPATDTGDTTSHLQAADSSVKSRCRSSSSIDQRPQSGSSPLQGTAGGSSSSSTCEPGSSRHDDHTPPAGAETAGSGSDNENDDDEQEEEEEEEVIRGPAARAWSLPCGHAYHHRCLLQWLRQCHTNGVPARCPLCQAGIKLQVQWRLPIPWDNPDNQVLDEAHTMNQAQQAEGQQAAGRDVNNRPAPQHHHQQPAVRAEQQPGQHDDGHDDTDTDGSDEDSDDDDLAELVLMPIIAGGGEGGPGIARHRPARRVRPGAAAAGGGVRARLHDNLLLPPPLAALGDMSMLRLKEYQREVQELLVDMPQIPPTDDWEQLQHIMQEEQAAAAAVAHGHGQAAHGQAGAGRLQHNFELDLNVDVDLDTLARLLQGLPREQHAQHAQRDAAVPAAAADHEPHPQQQELQHGQPTLSRHNSVMHVAGDDESSSEEGTYRARRRRSHSSGDTSDGNSSSDKELHHTVLTQHSGQLRHRRPYSAAAGRSSGSQIHADDQDMVAMGTPHVGSTSRHDHHRGPCAPTTTAHVDSHDSHWLPGLESARFEAGSTSGSAMMRRSAGSSSGGGSGRRRRTVSRSGCVTCSPPPPPSVSSTSPAGHESTVSTSPQSLLVGHDPNVTADTAAQDSVFRFGATSAGNRGAGSQDIIMMGADATSSTGHGKQGKRRLGRKRPSEIPLTELQASGGGPHGDTSLAAEASGAGGPRRGRRRWWSWFRRGNRQ